MKNALAKGCVCFLVIAGLLSTAWALVAPVALADDSFRCGSELVGLGDTTGKVFMRCGAPTWKEPVGYVNGYQETQLWYYNCGVSDFLYVLRFVGGRLQNVESQGYGTGQSDCYGPGRHR